MVRNKKDITDIIASNNAQIADFGAKSLGLFGSFVRDQATIESDIDLIVEFLPDQKNYDNFIKLVYFLEDVFDRKVELITKASLSKHLKPHVDKTVEYVSIGV